MRSSPKGFRARGGQGCRGATNRGSTDLDDEAWLAGIFCEFSNRAVLEPQLSSKRLDAQFVSGHHQEVFRDPPRDP